MLRIGVFDQSSAGWMAGASYTRMLVRSLEQVCQQEGAELLLFSRPNAPIQNGSEAVRKISLPKVGYLPGERGVRRALGLPEKAESFRGEQRLRHWLRMPDNSDVFAIARKNCVSVLMPLLDVPPWDIGVGTIGWIPDFQHVYLPEYFPESDRKRRDAIIRRLGERTSRIMLSSQSALSNFMESVPEYADKCRVIPFPSLFAFHLLPGDPKSVVKKFNLPEKFALVANQFWAHKNHLVVVEAIRRLRDEGVRVPVVMTGLPLDNRDPHNQVVSNVLQAIAMAGVNDQVVALGQVCYEDLTGLMRSAAVIIQPSRFEGWSTIVEDAKALGRPLICSDLSVHREQVPQAAGFFNWEKSEDLADLLGRLWNSFEPGPDREKERLALAEERALALSHGRRLFEVCLEASVS